MNIFLPQSVQTQIELEEIAAVERQIISPSSSRTSIGVVQDGLLGAYNMTHPNMKIAWRPAMNMIANTTLDEFSFFKKGEKEYTGRDLYSVIIPKNIYHKNDTITINNGQIVDGQIDQALLKAKKKNNLIQLIWDEYGIKPTREFLDNAQWLINNFNLYNGFTVGVGDIYVPEKIKEEIGSYIAAIESTVNMTITNKENKPDFMDEDLYELNVFSKLNVIREDVAKLVSENLPETNNFKIMMDSGSKGGAQNVGQMTGCVGLQASEGRLIQKKYNRRTLAYFHQDDDRAVSRGLIKQSYQDGLEFPEFVYHALTGREGLIDQAIKTAETGYAQRRLVKSLEDIMIKYDGTVRLANDNMIQMVYGDSGADTTKQYEYRVDMVKMSNSDIKEQLTFSPSELKKVKNFEEYDNKKLFHEIRIMRNRMRKAVQRARMDYRTIPQQFMIPINIVRIIGNTVKNNDNDAVIDDPKYILSKIEMIINNDTTKLVCMTKSEKQNSMSFKFRDDRVAKTLIKAAVYNALSPKKVIFDYKFDKKQFDTVVQKMIDGFNKNIIEPGEMVGIISAQSMGEPLTQMTLNAFHHSGIGNMAHTTLGVPRIKELLSVSKNPKTPQMIIYLSESHRTSREMANKIASHIKYTTLGHIREKLNIYFDSEPMSKGGFMEADNIGKPFYTRKASRNSCQVEIDNLPWLLRLELSREKMIEKEVTLLEIKAKFCNWWERRHLDSKSMKKEERRVLHKITSLAILSNSDSDMQPVIHIRFNVKDVDKVKDPFNTETLNSFIDNIVDKFKLKGINDIDDINTIAPDRIVTFGKNTQIDENYYDEKDNEEEAIKEEYIIYTSGVNLTDVRYIHGIDLDRTISDNILEVYETFGIEITRTVLMREIINGYERAGSSVNYQHVSVLVDMMTAPGYIVSIDRHGVNKSDADPLCKASFEKTVEQLLTASVFGESDYMRGISARIMAGLVIRGGTGYPVVKVNTKMIQDSEYIEGIHESNQKSIDNGGIAADIITNNKGSKEIFIPTF